MNLDQTQPMECTADSQSTRIPTAEGYLHVRRWQSVSQGAKGGAQGKAPMVLLHDSLGSVALWRDFPAQLAEATQRTVLAYDRLGFGLSDAAPGPLALDFVAREVETFAQVCKAMGVERFVALGHSVGGGMAAHVAAAYPRQCMALVTASAQTFVEERTLEGIRVARDQFAQPGQLERLARYHGDKAAWVLSAWVETWLSPAFADYSLEVALRQVRCPVLAIHGEQDEYGSLAHPRNIAAWVAGPVEQEIVAGGGHVPHREQPERMLARIAGFLQALPDGV